MHGPPKELPGSCVRAPGAPSFIHARRRSSIVSQFLTEELLRHEGAPTLCVDWDEGAPSPSFPSFAASFDLYSTTGTRSSTTGTGTTAQ